MEDVTDSTPVTATAPGFSQASMVVDIVQPAMRISGIGTSIPLFSNPDPFQVFVGIPNADSSAIYQYQAVRVSDSPSGVVATVENSAPSVGQLETLDGTGQAFEITIPRGESSSSSTVSQGGIAFQPVGTGTTTVSAWITGFISTDDAAADVTVTMPAITMPGDLTVGAGLQYGPCMVRLDAENHGGLDLLIQSSNPATALVAPDRYTAGSESITLHIDNGIKTGSFYIQGVEEAEGTVTITASAPGFVSDSMAVEVVRPALCITGLSDSASIGQEDIIFRVCTGIPNSTGTALYQYQAVRVKENTDGVTATVSSSDPGVAELVTDSETGGSVSVVVSEGANCSENTVEAGGVAMSVLSAGETTISAEIPSFTSVQNASVTVTVE